MAILSQQDVAKIAEEIGQNEEVTRRTYAKRRHDIYKDGGRKFLIEQLTREFSAEAIKEMRLAPINILKKIVNKLSSIYKQPPVRKCTTDADQVLVDYYVEELEFDQKMKKANRYYNLQSNTVLYIIPKGDELQFLVEPPYLYSVVPNPSDPCYIDTFVFNAFIEEGRVAPQTDLSSATGAEGFSRDTGTKVNGDKVASQEKAVDLNRTLIWWNDDEHFTTDANGNRYSVQGLGPEQYINPIGRKPIVNLAKDRDGEAWATQGEDLIDMTIVVQLGLTDILTIAKHQGYSVMMITSPEQPEKMTMGINKAIWMKQPLEGNAPTMEFLSGNSKISEYTALLLDVVGMILSTNDMVPGSISGNTPPQAVASGFSRLIQMSDTLEAAESDKPVLRDAEKDAWDVVMKWHNYMYDTNTLNEEARALGKFSNDFNVSISYQDIKPIESEADRLAAVKQLRDLGLATKTDMLKRLYPDLSNDQIDAKLKEIQDESVANVQKMQTAFGQAAQQQNNSVAQQDNQLSFDGNSGAGQGTQVNGNQQKGNVPV